MYIDEQFATNLDDEVLVSAYLKPSLDVAIDGSFCWDYFWDLKIIPMMTLYF